jgi:hypothetical protein
MESALDELARHWGSAYRITHDARGWPAIRADYDAHPVSRQDCS